MANKTTLKIGKELVASTAGDIKASLLKEIHESPAVLFELDFSETRNIDSVGLGVLLSVDSEAKKQGRTIELKNVRRNILGVMKIMRIDRQLKVNKTIKGAA